MTRSALILQSSLRSYSSLIFLDSAWAGAVLLAMTMAFPAVGLGGFLAVITAQVAALAFGYPRELIRTGVYGISPLLVGMSLPYFTGFSTPTFIAVIPAALLTMVMSTLLSDRCYRNYRIGSFSLAFAIVSTFFAVNIAKSYTGINFPAESSAMPYHEMYLRSMGAIFFMPHPAAGLIILTLLVIHSRVLAVLSAWGFFIGTALFTAMGGDVQHVAFGMVGLNFIGVAMAIGGVFLLPGPLATLHAAAATAATALAGLICARAFEHWHLPVFSWPFNLVAICWLAALSLRQGDVKPRSTWGLKGSPEEMASQAALLNRLPRERFLARLPIMGEWTVTQAVDGAPTHRPPWSHAWDFEVLDDAGFPFKAEPVPGHEGRVLGGALLADYFSFGAPVVAVADGTIVAAVAGIIDNPPGSSNTHENFGNHVIIQHGERLFSVYAHLKNGSIHLYPGCVVRAGQVIGQCGSSGRSPRPHLHFHFQADAVIGSPTLAVRFGDYIVRDVRTRSVRLEESGSPALFERVTPIASFRGARPAPRLEPGIQWNFDVASGGRSWREQWKSDIDLFGGIRIRADEPAAEAVWKADAAGITAIAFSGSRKGALYAFFRGNSRILSYVIPGVPWTDRLSANFSAHRAARIAGELLLPFAPVAGTPIELHPSETDHSDRFLLTAKLPGHSIATQWDPAQGPTSIESVDLTAQRFSDATASRCENAESIGKR